MNLNLGYSHQRALDDMLQAEQAQQESNEIVIRDLRQVLLEIATKIDGRRIEALRRADPKVPSSWGAKEWRAFFGAGWWGISSASPQREAQAQRELMQQIEGLKAKLLLAEKALEQERAKPPVVITALAEASPLLAMGAQVASPSVAVADPAKPKQSFTFPANITPPATGLVGDTKSILPTLPQKPPVSFADRLKGGGRSGFDLVQAYQRYWITLYLIGRWGLASALEIDNVMGEVVTVKPGSGSLKRILDDLVESGFVIADLFKNPQSSLVIARLSPDGEKLYQAIFAKRPVENEWSRLIRLGRGVNHIQLAITAAMHARKRGYAAQVSEAKPSEAAFDLLLVRDNQSLRVNTEPSLGKQKRDWRSLSAKGRVAVFTWMLSDRARIVDECKKINVSGMATDLETLVKAKYKGMNEESPLWLESW